MEKPLTILAKKLRHRCLTEPWIYLWTFYRLSINPLSANPTKWSNTLNQFVGNLPTNCLSVFGHFVGLALKGLIFSNTQSNWIATVAINKLRKGNLNIQENRFRTYILLYTIFQLFKKTDNTTIDNTEIKWNWQYSSTSERNV